MALAAPATLLPRDRRPTSTVTPSTGPRRGGQCRRTVLAGPAVACGRARQRIETQPARPRTAVRPPQRLILQRRFVTLGGFPLVTWRHRLKGRVGDGGDTQEVRSDFKEGAVRLVRETGKP